LYSEVEIEDFTFAPLVVIEELVMGRVRWDILNFLSCLWSRRGAHDDLNFSYILVLGKLESIRNEVYEHLEDAARIQYCPIYAHVLDAVLCAHLERYTSFLRLVLEHSICVSEKCRRLRSRRTDGNKMRVELGEGQDVIDNTFLVSGASLDSLDGVRTSVHQFE
jgi:hypothetical protein